MRGPNFRYQYLLVSVTQISTDGQRRPTPARVLAEATFAHLHPQLPLSLISHPSRLSLKPRLLSSSSKPRPVTMEAAGCGSRRRQGTTVGHGGGGWRQRPPSNEGHWTWLQRWQGGHGQCSLVASAHPRCVDHRAALDPPPCHLYTGTAMSASNSMQVKI
jgi:hypothetical protein